MATYCPNCGKQTTKQLQGNVHRDACPDSDCGYVDYPLASLGVGAVVFRDESVLLIERNESQKRWTIPGGYVELHDNIVDAVVREVREETALDVIVQGLIVVRNMQEFGRNDIFCVFLCATVADDQQPMPDMQEVTQARFVKPDEFSRINLDSFEQWLFEYYDQQQPMTLISQLSDYEHAKTFAVQS